MHTQIAQQNIELFQTYIDSLCNEGAFEIWSPDNQAERLSSIYIPYMMNDAMECFITLENATLVGHFDRSLMADTTVSIELADAQQAEKNLLIIKQRDENTCTLWFDSFQIQKHLYCFHEIYHPWKAGNEQWSQMVYMIGTMYDKFLFHGEEACNETELSIMKLVEFAPFRFYSPSAPLFDSLYDNTKAGADLMAHCAFRAKDFSYGLLCSLYGVLPLKPLGTLLTKLLLKKRHYKLYAYIYEKAMAGASAYPARHYMEDAENQRISQLRTSTHEQMCHAGFTGTYPDYKKELLHVHITEEQPFTIMDWEEITFSQTFFLSFSTLPDAPMNLGFFQGKNLSCQVLSREAFFAKY